jgi:hypothetical protein
MTMMDYHKQYTLPRIVEVRKQLMGSTIFDVEQYQGDSFLNYGALLSVSLHCVDGIDRKLLITGDTMKWLAVSEIEGELRKDGK